MNRFAVLCAAALSMVVIISCGDDGVNDDDTETPPDYSTRGPSAVGVATTSLTDASRARTLPVEVWYPAEAAGDASEVLDFESDPDRQTTLSTLLASAPAECVARTTAATREAAPIAGDYPVVLYSHCYTCTRWSAHAVMEWLASHGFIVVAPDHTEDTLFDRVAGNLLPIDTDLLAVRIADMRFVLDSVLGGEVLPEGTSPDAARVGVLGHSIGSLTAGGVAQDDDRVAAVFGMAAPMENPVVPGVFVTDIDVPLGLLVATEDHSVGELGNGVIRNNFEAANPPAYKIEIVDAGHWSVTNIAGINEFYAPGCGEDLRQSNQEPFSYIAVERANALTAAYVTAFFAAHLDGEETALELLAGDPWPGEAQLSVRE